MRAAILIVDGDNMPTDNSVSLWSLIDTKLIPNNNIPDFLYEQLFQLIVSEVLPTDYCFPNEIEMSKHLSIGRTSVREAYKALEMKGLIRRTRRGTFVNKVEEISTALPLVTMINQSDFNEFIEVRSLLEAQIALLAAQRASQEDISYLENYYQKMQKHKGDIKSISYYDAQFHMALADAAHNTILKKIILMMSETLISGIYSSFGIDTEENVAQALSSHSDILDSIKKNDFKRAYDVMYEHIQNIRNRGIVN